MRPLWRWAFWRVWCLTALPWLLGALGLAAYQWANQGKTATGLLAPGAATASDAVARHAGEAHTLLDTLIETRFSPHPDGAAAPLSTLLPLLEHAGGLSGVFAAGAWASVDSAAWIYRGKAERRWYLTEERRGEGATLTELAAGFPTGPPVPVRVPEEWRARGEHLAQAMRALKEGGHTGVAWHHAEQLPVSQAGGYGALAVKRRGPDTVAGAMLEIDLAQALAAARPAAAGAWLPWATPEHPRLFVVRWATDGSVAPLDAATPAAFPGLFHAKRENFKPYLIATAMGLAWVTGSTVGLPGGETLFAGAALPAALVRHAALFPAMLLGAVFLFMSLALWLAHRWTLGRLGKAIARDVGEVRRLDVLRGPYYWPKTGVAELAALREAVQEAAAGLDKREESLKSPVLVEAVVRAVPVEGEAAPQPTPNLPLAPPAAFVQAMDTARRQLGEARKELEALRAAQRPGGPEPAEEIVLAERLLAALRNRTDEMSAGEVLAAALGASAWRMYAAENDFTRLRDATGGTPGGPLPAELVRAGHPLLFLALERAGALWVDDAAADPRCGRIFAERALGGAHSLAVVILGDGAAVWAGLRARGEHGWRAAEQIFGEAVSREERQLARARADARQEEAPAHAPGSAHALWAQPSLPLDPDRPMYREMVDSAPAGLFTLDRRKHFTYVNAAAERLFGAPGAELLGQPLLGRAAPGEEGAVRSALQRVQEGAAVEERDVHFRRGLAGPRLLRLILSPLQDEGGEPRGIHGCVLDVTELRARELALSRQEAVYRGIVEGAPQLLWSVDAIGCLTFVNGVCQPIYGCAPEELIGKPVTALADTEHAPQDVERLALLLSGKPCTGYRTLHRHKDGSEIPLVIVATRQLDEAGHVTGAVGLAIALSDEAAG